MQKTTLLSVANYVGRDKLPLYTVYQKKQPLCFLVITSAANINRFSKFFHRQIPKKTG